MSYARRLLAMSTRAAAPSRPVALPIEEQIADEAPAPTMAAPALRAEPVAPAEVEPALVPSAPPPMQPRVIREVPAPETRVVAPPLEIARVEQPVLPRAPEPLPVPPAPAPAPIVAREPIAPLPNPGPAAPTLPAWLTDEPDGPDPLESLAQSDEARDLMRAIRRWTSAPVPAPVASPPPPPPVEAPPVPDPPAADPVQLSIGNVVITVEDTPAAPRRAAATPSVAHTGGSRLARHYFRGR